MVTYCWKSKWRGGRTPGCSVWNFFCFSFKSVYPSFHLLPTSLKIFQLKGLLKFPNLFSCCQIKTELPKISSFNPGDFLPLGLMLKEQMEVSQGITWLFRAVKSWSRCTDFLLWAVLMRWENNYSCLEQTGMLAAYCYYHSDLSFNSGKIILLAYLFIILLLLLFSRKKKSTWEEKFQTAKLKIKDNCCSKSKLPNFISMLHIQFLFFCLLTPRVNSSLSAFVTKLFLFLFSLHKSCHILSNWNKTNATWNTSCR